jgi:hypothetical protein
MCEENSCNVFLLLFMALWVLISATLFRRAMLVVWHACVFLGLRFFPPFFFFLVGGLHCFLLVRIFLNPQATKEKGEAKKPKPAERGGRKQHMHHPPARYQ